MSSAISARGTRSGITPTARTRTGGEDSALRAAIIRSVVPGMVMSQPRGSRVTMRAIRGASNASMTMTFPPLRRVPSTWSAPPMW